MEERAEILARVSVEHRTVRGWAFGWGKEFGAPDGTAGADCRCGKRFLRYDPNDDPQAGWAEHWAVESVAALEAAGYTIARLEQIGTGADLRNWYAFARGAGAIDA